MTADVLFPFLAAIVGGALRVGVPFLFVSLGECLTEKSGRINLGLEGVLVLSAMAGFGGSYLTGSPWLGVLAAASAGALLGLLHGLLCSLPRVNDVATGIALMLLGTGLAFYLGKPLIQPQATQLPPIALGAWSDSSVLQAALQINPLLPLGVALAVLMQWGFARTRWGLLVRLAGDSAPATKALGYSTAGIRIAATAAGGAIAGLGGASLSLFYPGSWNEGISSGQGLIAVALVIFARWSPGRGAVVWRRRGHRPGLAIHRHQPGLLLVWGLALCAHAGDFGHHLQAGQGGAGQPRRVVFEQMNEAKRKHK
jgi:general nucleoside transport system permease protein